MKHMGIFFKDENGQGMLEYGLIISLIALVIVIALSFFGNKVESFYSNEELLDVFTK